MSREYQAPEAIRHSAQPEAVPDDESSLSDIMLAKRILLGDMELLGSFLKNTCYPKFCKFSKSFFSLKLLPDEIMSIACIHVTEYNMSVFRAYAENNRGSLKDYVLNMVKRRLGDLLKKQKQRETIVADGEDLVWQNPEDAPADAVSNVRDILVGVNIKAYDLHCLLAKLPLPQQVALLKVKIQGYSVKEVGKELGVPPRQVYCLIAAAKQQLKSFISHEQ